MDQLTAIANTAAGKLWGYSFAYDADGRVTQKTGPVDSTGLPSSTTLYASGPDASGANDTVFKSVTVQGAAYNYFYDALNRRRYKSYPTGISDEFFYDLGHQLLVDQGNSTLSPATAVPVLDEYVWLGGRPVAIIRGNLTAAWAHQADSTGSCGRNSEAANCGAYFPVTDVIGKAVLMLNAAGRIAGTGEYDPFGHVNRVFVDAETPHPYNLTDPTPFADFTQPIGSGMQLDMRVFVDSLDLDPLGAAAGCTADARSADSLRILDGTSNALLASLSATHDGLLASSWVRPSTGRIKLALTGSGHCEMQQGCPCDPNTGICPDCPPGACNLMFCDGISTTTTATGVIAGTYEYRRYEAGQVPLWTPLRFPGQYYDAESYLFENWNRYYDPRSSLFLRTDPLLDFTSISSHLSGSYGYAAHNPMAITDPTGLYIKHGECKNWTQAVELALQKAGCRRSREPPNDCKCKDRIHKCLGGCDICEFLTEGNRPHAYIGELRSPWTNNAAITHVHRPGYLSTKFGIAFSYVEINPQWQNSQGNAQCESPAAVTELADTLIHEALHVCEEFGHPRLGEGDGDCSAGNITRECMK